ncbi:MAG: chromate transporter [Arcicella sp.]|jgi:chromate transporter|nr:chromate transporter [Arcicella sp.]
MKNNYTLLDISLYFLKLGTIGFGGPVALVGFMYRDLVEQKQWISDEEYKEGLALAQLAPGPLAAQLAIYLGYVHYGVLGASLVGFAFVIPSFLMVLVLGFTYQKFGGLPWMQSVFYGISAGVIGIIAFSSYKLVNKSIGNDRILWGIFIVSALATIVTESENVLLFLGAGTLYWFVKAPPKFTQLNIFVPVLLQIPALTAENTVLWKIFLFFSKAGAFVFGSGLAIVPFLYSGVVKEYGWLNEQQFLDSVAVAMITPGPVVITVGFIGYLVAGFKGAGVAALATFLPCYLLTILPAPYFKKYGKRPAIKAFVDGVTASAIGAIAGAVVILGKKSLIDIPTALIAVVVVLLLWKSNKITEPIIIVGCAIVGIFLKNYFIF